MKNSEKMRLIEQTIGEEIPVIGWPEVTRQSDKFVQFKIGKIRYIAFDRKIIKEVRSGLHEIAILSMIPKWNSWNKMGEVVYEIQIVVNKIGIIPNDREEEPEYEEQGEAQEDLEPINWEE